MTEDTHVHTLHTDDTYEQLVKQRVVYVLYK